ncbi:MAG: GntR family transcriptional regulator [Bryobacteraceae bacterium]
MVNIQLPAPARGRPAASKPTAARTSLNRGSPVPLFAQITQKLRESLQQDLRSGRLKPGDFFITEKAICEQFGVSVITAKRVLDDLESEGVVARQQGRGTYVAPSRVSQVLDHFYRFATGMEQQGFHPTWKNLKIDVARSEAKIAKPLNLAPGARVIRLERLRLLNEEPYFLQTSYLPEKLFPGLERENHDGLALYDILEQKYHVQPVHCRDTFEPALVHRREAKLLQVPVRSAGMLLERIAYDAEGRPVELSRGVIRGDRWRLTADLR